MAAFGHVGRSVFFFLIGGMTMTKYVKSVLTAGGLVLFMTAGVGGHAFAVEGTSAKHMKNTSKESATNSQAEYEDKMITYKIRKSIANDVTLSQAAQNLKIETSKGVVSLKGPVANVGEQSIVVAMAEAVAGKTNVKSDIEVPK